MSEPPFRLATHDPEEEFDDVPASALSLEHWRAARQAGTAPFAIDPYEGVDVELTDGADRLYLASFGDPRSLARNCEVAADRLAAGRLALLRTAILDQGNYVLLVPDRDVVQVARTLEAPPRGRPFPYRPSLQGDPDEAIDALYAWAEANAPRLLAPSGNPALDRAQGKRLRLSRPELVAALRSEVGPAYAVADLVGARAFAPGAPRG